MGHMQSLLSFKMRHKFFFSNLLQNPDSCQQILFKLLKFQLLGLYVSPSINYMQYEQGCAAKPMMFSIVRECSVL